jgi:hypothetical protein
MKKIHWKTRQAIIRDYEKRTRLVVTVRGHALLDASFHDMRLIAPFGCKIDIFKIELDNMLRRP